MSVAQATNLSLLSRGVGEVQHGGHEKIEVKLEPEDYNNWLEDPRRVWNVPAVLPPIQQSYHPPQFHSQHGESGNSTSRDPPESDTHRSKTYQTTSHDSTLSRVYLPKTFTTRKGALLLFSEDFANKHLSGKSVPGVEKQDGNNAPELRTVDDLAKSILAYGATKSFSYNQEQSRDDVYLGFVHTRTRKYYERQCKPGFSAKRYLSSWSKLWDFSLLDKLTTKGFIKPVPYQKKSDYDVSGIPLPYRILRQWLFAPGSIDGYTFYRQSKLQTSREPTIVVVEETPRPISVVSEISDGSIKVTSLLANKELNYGELDSTTKESILTELLVKSAITHAIKKQKEYQETVTKNFEDEEEKRKASAKLYEFDMMNAIQTALDSTAIPTVSTFNLDPQGLIPSKTKTKKEKKGFRGTKGFGLQVSTTTSSSVGSATSMRSSFDQKHKVLPPIVREEQKLSKPITIGGQIPTIPTHYDAPPATVTEVDEEYVKWRQSVLSDDKQIADSSSGLSKNKSKSLQSLSKVSLDAESSLGLENDHDMDDKKSIISTMSLFSMASKRSKFSSAGFEAPYTKGITSRQDPTTSLLKVDMTGDENDPSAAITSWKYKAEEKEPVKVEEVVEVRKEVTPVFEEAEESVSSVRLPEIQAPPTPNSVPSAFDDCTPTPLPTPQEAPAQLTENEFMEVLTEQAREIAKAVLEQNPEAGLDLATDAKNAAELLMSNLPDGETTATGSRAESQSANVVEEPAVDVQDGEAADGVKGDIGEVTVGQLVKEGLENLVHKIDEYVTADGTKTEGSSAHTPSIASGPASVPGTEAHTPSVKSSRLSSAQLEAGSVAGEDWNSVPSAQGVTPAESRLTRLSDRVPSSAMETAQGGSRTGSTSLSKLTSRRSSAAGGVNAGELADGTYSVASAEEASTPKRSVHSVTPKKSAGTVKHESEFVVGKVADKTELQQLYAPIDPPSPSKSKGKGGKAKPIVPKPAPTKKEPAKKVEKAAAKKVTKKVVRKEKKPKESTPARGSDVSPSEKTVSPVPTPKQPSPVAPKEPTPEPELEEWKTPEPVEEPDMEFVIVREEFSDEEEEKPQLGSVKSLNFAPESPEPSVGASSTQDEEIDFNTSDEEFEVPPGLSNREAQAAKRAAAKERRRKEVEKRRREREEALRKEKEDAERKERIRIQMEEDRQRREDEIRQRKEMEKMEQERLEREEEARLKAERDAQERERRRQEERARYLEEKKRRALEEEQRRKELQAQREAEEAEQRRLEEEMLKAMAEEEREEYLRKKAEEDRLQRIADEEARIRREEENRRVREELQRQEMERRRAEEILRQRLMFQRSLNVEAHGMDHSQDITRAFVFSYYELLKWLGYEVPEWAQYGPAPSADFVYNNHPNENQEPNDSSNQRHADH